MHKRSKYEIVTVCIPLPEDFPCGTSGIFTQKDRDILYLHRHECWELGYCLDGNGIFVIGDRILTFEGGDCAVIPPGVVHLARSTPGTESHWKWTYLDLEYILMREFPEKKLNDLATRPPCGIFKNDFLSELLRALQDMPFGMEEKRGAVILIAGTLLRLPEESRLVLDQNFFSMDSRLIPALQILSESYCTRLSLSDLAKKCGMSPVNFRRVFEKAMNCPPGQYIRRLRIVKAKLLLSRRNKTIQEIAHECGYQTISCFNRAFIQETGHAPSFFLKRKTAVPDSRR